jgi:hypothetical protein
MRSRLIKISKEGIKMDTNFLKDWAVKLNVKENILTQNFNDALKEMKNVFPNQSEETIFEKAKMKIKSDYKRKFLTSAIPFIGVVLGNTSVSDNMEGTRNKQLEIYIKAKEESEKSGDATILQKVFDNNIVKLDESTGKIIPLWPKNKKDGTLSKVAGKPMPTSEDSQSQLVFGIATIDGTDDIKPFKLTLKGKACNPDFKTGKIVSFKALNKSEKGSTFFTLDTNQTDFIETTHEKIQAGIDKVGIVGVINSFFKDYLVSWDDIKSWINQKKENPESNPLPKKFSGFDGIMMIPAMCVYQNFTADSNDRIKMVISSTTLDDLDDATILCLIDKKLDKNIDFAVDSKIIAIGKPWLPKAGEDGQVRMMLLTSAMYSFPDWRVPRIENVKEITPANLSSEAKIVKTEEKPTEKNEDEDW